MASQKEIHHSDINYNLLEKTYYNVRRTREGFYLAKDENYEPHGREAFIFFRHALSEEQEKLISQPSICKLHFGIDRTKPDNLDLALKTFFVVLSSYPNLVMDFKIVKDNDGTREGAEITCLLPSNGTFVSNTIAARQYIDFAGDVEAAFSKAKIVPANISKLDRQINTYGSYRVGHNGSFRHDKHPRDLAGKHIFQGCLYISTFDLGELHTVGALEERSLSNPNIYEVSGGSSSLKGRSVIPVSIVIPSDEDSPIKSQSLPDYLGKEMKRRQDRLKPSECRSSPTFQRHLELRHEEGKGHVRSFSR